MSIARESRRRLEGVAARALDLLLPSRCLGCRTRGSWLCPGCADDLPRLAGPGCRVCAAPLAGTLVCPDCYRDPPGFDSLRAPWRHEGLARELVHALKFGRQRHLAPILARLAAGALDPAEPPAAVVAVPLHPERQRERGFNQAALLAQGLGAALGVPVREALVRTRPTASQTGLSPAERASNVRGAFAAVEPLPGARLLLVDDVCTTGATLGAAARALRRAGAARVDALVVTRAVSRA